LATREQTEKEFRSWQDLPDGGRRYWKDRKGKMGFQRLIKIVDAQENTLLFLQEVYNDEGVLIEAH
jgi:ribosomal protein S10